MATYFRAGCFALLMVASGVVHGFAQSRATTADLSGTVIDESKAVLPGATVTATSAETGLVRTAVTDGQGRFSIPAIAVGLYDVRAELAGFAPQVHQQLRLALGSSVDLEFTLKIAGTEEQITVVGAAPLVDTQKTVVSTVVTQQQIENLPINGRNFISFSVITPGVAPDRTPQQGASATTGLTFAGQRARSNNITVDGLDNNDAVVGSVRATFSQEAVREFQVLTNSYSAEFGKASGGVVNIVTKSGTNTIDGNAFFFFRDQSLNSKGHFEKFDPAGTAIDSEKAPFNQKQFGGTIGGPVRRDKTFFFVSVERLDVAASNFVTIDDRTPVSLFGRPIPSPSGRPATAAQLLRDAGFQVETGNVGYGVESTQFLAKVDHLVNPNNTLTIRFNAADDLNENIEPFGGLIARSRAAKLDSRDQMLAGSYASVLSSRLVNEARFQVAHRDAHVLALDPLCDGECDRTDEGGPTVEILGVASVGRHRFTPQPKVNTRYQFVDTVSYYVGNHQFKTGIDYNYIDNSDQSLPLHFGGRYVFAPLPAATAALFGLPGAITAIQAFALGIPGAYVQGYGSDSRPYTYSDISLFVQDDWRLSPKLTAKLGLRYQNQFWPATTYTSFDFHPPYGFPTDNNNIAPRLAVAWDPAGDKKTSVHGAYGVFYDNLITGMIGITDILDGVNLRTLVARPPTTIGAWRSVATGRKLPEAAVPRFASLQFLIDPGLKTPYAHHVSGGVDRELPGDLAVSANFVYVRGFDQIGTVDYNPIVPSLGPGRRPADVNGVAGTSATILQYTTFAETWYKGLTVSATKRYSNRYQFLASYTLSKTEDNSTDFQSAFLPQDSGRGRNPADLDGLPIGFDPDAERGPSLQDQRHRFVFSGLYVAPWDIQVSSIVTLTSGRPFNILAGVDFNGDGDSGAIPGSDRARTNPADPTTSVPRNSGRLPNQAVVDVRVAKRLPFATGASVDAILEVFNLFNRTNFTDLAGYRIAGPGAFPGAALPTFGQFESALPPRQIQLALKVNF
ncbi:MAG: TonB-dependent receptor [Acidobacteria bacterium]|nr:TonB-dependent receptor [Acidobacteriota bacterium]